MCIILFNVYLQISKVLEKFEAQFEDLDVVSSYMGDAMGSSTACATPEDEVSIFSENEIRVFLFPSRLSLVAL